MKKIISLIICISVILSLVPISFAVAETEYFFHMREAEDCTNTVGALGGFEIVNDRERGASGIWSMKAKNISSTNEPTVLPLCDDEVYTQKAGKYKLYIRVRGQDSIKWKVENANSPENNTFKTVWFSFEANEYKWILLTEIELAAGYNTVAFASYKANLYFDKFAITDNPLYYPVGTGQDMSEGNGLSDVYPAPGYYPPANTHPRVFLNDSILAQAKAHLNGGNSAVFSKVKQYAAVNRTGNLPQDVNYNNYNYASLECAKANAFLYLVTEDKATAEAHADKAIRIMTNYMSTLKYKPAGSLMEMRGTGSAIVCASIVYDWCYNAECFTDDRKEALIMSCVNQASKLECGWPPVNLSIFDNGHGGENSIMKDMFSFAIAVYDEYPEIYDMVGGRIFNEFIPAVNHHYEKGTAFHRAGDDYGVYRFEHEVYMKLLLDGIGLGHMLSDNQRLNAYQHIIRLRPDGGTFRDGDLWNYAASDGSYSIMNTASLSFYCAYLFDDPYLKSFFTEQMPNPVKIEQGGDFSPVMYLIYNNPDQEERPIEELPLAIYSGDESGLMTVRTSWDTGRASDTLAVSMKLPEMWYANHQHLDAGQFEIFYKGPLAIDSGMYQSDPFYDSEGNYITSGLEFGSEHHVNYAGRTIAHNTMLVYNPSETNFGKGKANDGGQRAKYNYPHNMNADDYLADNGKAGEVISVDIGDDLYEPSYTYQKADLTDWYSDKVSLFERSFMFLNFGDETYPGAVVVFDRVKSSDASYKKSWLLHSQNEPEVEDNITVIERNDNGYTGRLVNETLLPESHTITKVGGDGYEYYVDGKNYNATPKKEESDESGNWRIELSPAEENTEDYFLNVLTVSDNDDSIERLPAELIETELFYGVKVKNRVAMFSKETEKISDSFSFNIAGEGELEFQIANLAKGSWQVSDGTGTKEINVSERGAVLSFKGNPGAYTVTKISDTATEKNLDFLSNVKPKESAYIDTFPCMYTDSRSITIYAKATLSNGFEIKDRGVIFTGDKNGTIKSSDAIVFQNKKTPDGNGRFGIKIIDAGNKLKSGYFKTYVTYFDDGEEKTVYGEAISLDEPEVSSISVGGKLVDGFDSSCFSYEYILPWNWKAEDGFPEITAKGNGTVTVTNPTAETMEAVITVSLPTSIPSSKEYTVKFTIDPNRPSVEKKVAFGRSPDWLTGIIKDNTNIYSAAEQLSKNGEEVIYNFNNIYMCAFNQSINWSGYVPVIGYLQLDLTKISDGLDLSKPVKLNLCSRLNFYDKGTNNAPWSDGKVSIYDMSGFDWENNNLSTRALAADLTAIEGKKVIATFTAEDIPESTATVRQGNHDIDITEFVKECIEKGNLTPTLGFYVHKPETVTTVRNRIVYWIYKHNSDLMSYIVYNKFE